MLQHRAGMAATTTDSPLQQLLTRSVKAFPEKMAIRTESDAASYSQLYSLVGRVASGMIESGVGKMDRVAWLLPNCLEAVACTLACYSMGAISVPINVRYASEQVAYMVKKVEARILFLSVSHLDVLQELCGHLQLVVVGPGRTPHRHWDEFLQTLGHVGVVPVHSAHPALILFTSGSTGRPKGVLHSHGTCWAAVCTSAKAFGLLGEDVVLVGKAIAHAGGLQTQLLPTLLPDYSWTS